MVPTFLMRAPMRGQAEGLGAMDACCVEIAVFALVLAAWSFPNNNGDTLVVRADMTALQVASYGQNVVAKPEDRMALVPDGAPNAA